ncbi:MAG: SDR family NAD(P)-dependent oxidoreductase [Pseudomonadales bacterium]|nr:SDR family NAD(P)-dependent oxidoreductase [Pseudomonadales bacterium]
MSNGLDNKVVVVTGGAGGIGSEIARAFARSGAKVVIASRNLDKLNTVGAEIASDGHTCLPIACDVTEPEQVDQMVAKTIRELGGLDVLVNNAGGAMFVKPPEKMRPEEWRAAIALNLDSVFYCSVAAAKHMVNQDNGRIINISSVAGIKNSPSFVHYGAAKAAVISLTKSLAICWGPDNINVNCIAPGLTATEGVAQWLPAKTQEDGTPVPPLQYPPNPEDVADLAVFLGSSASLRISGELFPIRALYESV